MLSGKTSPQFNTAGLGLNPGYLSRASKTVPPNNCSNHTPKWQS